MNKLEKALIIFIRQPIAGQVKTRISKKLGNEKALAVYEKLLGHTRDITQKLSCKKYLYYSDSIDISDPWNNKVYEKYKQTSGNLGARMIGAFDNCFGKNHRKVLIIGSDCYDLTSDIITQAFDLLENADVVAGPASDGGYYLLGMKQFHPELFDIENWSTETVLAQTMAHCEKLALEYAYLPVLNDVDEVEDINFAY